MKKPEISTENPKSEENSFYKELDEKRSYASCCTCQTLILLLVSVLILCIGGLFFLYYRFKKIEITPIRTKISNLNYDLKINDNERGDLVLSESQLSLLFKTGIQIENFLLKDTEVSINDKNILLNGKILSFSPLEIVITTVPQVENNRVVLKVVKISKGNISMPTWVNSKVGKSLTDIINKKLEPIYKFNNPTSTRLENNKLIIEFEKK